MPSFLSSLIRRTPVAAPMSSQASKPVITAPPQMSVQKKPSLVSTLAKAVVPQTAASVQRAVTAPTVAGKVKAGAGAVVNAANELVVQPVTRTTLATMQDTDFLNRVNQTLQRVNATNPIQARAYNYAANKILPKLSAAAQTTAPVKAVVGTEPISGYSITSAYKQGTELGQLASDIIIGQAGQNMTPKSSNTLLNRVSQTVLPKTGGLLLAGLTASDLVPGGGGKKKVAKEATETALEKLARKTLKEAGQEVTEEAVQKTAQMLKRDAPDLVQTLSSKATKAGKRLTEATTAPTGTGKKALQTPQKLPTPEVSGRPFDSQLVSYDNNIQQAIPPVKPEYNTRNIQLPEGVKERVDDEVQKLAKEVRAANQGDVPLSFKEIQQRAEEAGQVYDELATREETKDLAASMFNLRRKLASDMQAGRVGQDFVANMTNDMMASRQLGQLLAARRMVATPDEKSLLEKMTKQLIKDGIDSERIIEAAKKFDLTTPEGQIDYYNFLKGSRKADWVDLIRYNSMLSNPLTHVVNAASNLMGGAVIAPLTRAVEGSMDAVRSLVTGTPRTVYAGEAVDYMKGFANADAVKQAASNFWDAMRGGSILDTPDTRHLPLTKAGTAMRRVEDTLRLPLRALEGADRFLSTLVQSGETAALNKRVAKGALDAGPAAIARMAKEKADYQMFRAPLRGKEQGYLLDGIDKVTGVLLKLTKDNNPVVSTVARFTLPFVKTPMNLFKQGIEYSPAGIFTLVGAKNKQEQLAKVAVGAASALGVANLLGDNRLTGAPPKTKDEYDRWLAAGIQPYSVKVGDKWYSYQKMHPAMAFNFALVTSIDEAMKNGRISGDWGQQVMEVIAKQMGFLADQSYMKAIGDFNKGLMGNPDFMARFAANYPKQLVPFRGMMGSIARMIDKLERQPDQDAPLPKKLLQEFEREIPWASMSLQPKLNPKTGEPISRQNRFFNALSPVKVTTETPEGAQYWAEQEAKNKYAGYSQEDKDAAVIRKREALEKYWELKNLPPDEAERITYDIYQNDRTLYNQMKGIAETIRDRSDADAVELQKLDVVTGSRARAIKRNLDQMGSDEERDAYLQDLWDKGVLGSKSNPTVYKQLQELIQQKENTQP